MTTIPNDDDTGPSIKTDFAGFRKMAGEFFRAAEGASFPEIENGHKALTLAYFGIASDLTTRQEVESVAILNLAGERLLRAEMAAA